MTEQGIEILTAILITYDVTIYLGYNIVVLILMIRKVIEVPSTPEEVYKCCKHLNMFGSTMWCLFLYLAVPLAHLYRLGKLMFFSGRKDDSENDKIKSNKSK